MRLKFTKRLFVLLVLVVFVSYASLAKSLGLHSQAIDTVGHLLVSDWNAHLIVAILLGFLASWATPKSVYQYTSIPISPWIWLLLIVVSLDEVAQLYLSRREFSFVDLGINNFGVLFGCFSYLFFERIVYPAYLRLWRKV